MPFRSEEGWGGWIFDKIHYCARGILNKIHYGTRGIFNKIHYGMPPGSSSMDYQQFVRPPYNSRGFASYFVELHGCEF